MVVVTDKKFYLDDNMVAIVENAIQRYKLKWDNLWLFDGEEGSGKSTFSVALCYYIAHRLGKPFSVDNVFFDLNSLIDYASRTEGQVLLWDESALGALATQWQNKTQNKLVQALMVARKKRHFWIFNIPKFHELRRYIVRRCIGLVHVYSQDGLKRGYFTYYKKEKKNWLYDEVKRTRKESAYRSFSFRGKFTQYDKIDLIDWEEYDRKKDEAILKSFGEQEKTTKTQEKFIRLRYTIYHTLKNNDLSLKAFAENFGVDPSVVYRWKDYDRKYPEIVGASSLKRQNATEN
jgi:energy-coupling factor transporter ATP-binding protein EcfA2|tara:strand:- start:4555 stop:5424 length:870 start_codon:yes stop_codon:yes gene_type:complete